VTFKEEDVEVSSVWIGRDVIEEEEEEGEGIDGDDEGSEEGRGG
jgi:hypothetical protein